MVVQESQSSAFWVQRALGPRASAQPEITILYLVGAFIPVEELRDMEKIFLHIPEEEPGPCPITALLFLSVFLHSPN